jgi:tetratricopeptide (TPR) repeat protein
MNRVKLPVPAETDRQDELYRRRLAVLDSIETARRADPLNWQLCTQAGSAALAASGAAPDPEQRNFCLRKAERCYREGVRLAPDRTSAQRPLARLCVFWKAKLPLAPQEYERLWKLYPTKSQFLIEWGDALLLNGRDEEALQKYRLALNTSRNVGCEQIHLSIMFENYNRMRWQRFALEELRKRLLAVAQKNKSPDPAVLLRLALIELAAEDFRQCLDYMNRATAAEPDDPQLVLLKGYAQRLNGQWDAALESFRTAGRMEKKTGRLAGPGAVHRAIYRADLARRLKDKRKTEAGVN